MSRAPVLRALCRFFFASAEEGLSQCDPPATLGRRSLHFFAVVARLTLWTSCFQCVILSCLERGWMSAEIYQVRGTTGGFHSVGSVTSKGYLKTAQKRSANRTPRPRFKRAIVLPIYLPYGMCVQSSFYHQLWINTWRSEFKQETDSILSAY